MKIMVLTFLIIAHLPQLVAQSDRSESPYFQVNTESATEGSMPLEQTSADVSITGPIADVTVNQTYHNRGTVPIEAIYVFPASTRAAVYAMEMKIGDRRIVARIKEKREARRTYEQAKAEGKRTSLLEQHRPNVFQMEVANILPGERIEVILKYTEFIIPEEQLYTFVYPTVVGPRYVSQPGDPIFVSNAPNHPGPWGHTVKSTVPTYKFDLDVKLNMPVPVGTVACPTHQMQIRANSDKDIEMTLDPIENTGGNRDVIIEFGLAGDEVLTGTMTYDNGEAKFFLCQIEPPSRSAEFEVVPREFIFVLDVSGSMHGFPLGVSKELMKKLLSSMRPIDKFNVLCFAGSNFTMFRRSADATRENIDYAFRQLNSLQGSGGTELLPALRSAMSIPKEAGYSRSFIIATDGYVMVEEQAFQYIESHLDKANFFAFGIGSSMNRHLIEGIAHVGRGEPFILTDQSNADEVTTKLRRYIEAPLLTDVSISSENIKIYDVSPSHIPDLMAERPLYVFGKFQDNNNGKLVITGRQGQDLFRKAVSIPQANINNSALPYLWARERLRALSDLNSLYVTEERKELLVELGLKYNLLSEHTSFVAVDEQIASDGRTVRTGQPLPLPQNVSQYAVGFAIEMESTVVDNPALFNVEVHCKNEEVKLLTESVLEILFAKLNSQDLGRLTDQKIIMEYSQKQGLTMHKGDAQLWSLIHEELESAFILLGLAPKKDVTITVHTSILENCK